MLHLSWQNACNNAVISFAMPTSPVTINATASELLGVKSAIRVLRVLEYFAQARQPATAAELRKHLDLPKSSCFALMETLRGAGYVYSVGRDEGYYPTVRWLDLANAVSLHDPVLAVAAPALQMLRDLSGETAILAKLEGVEVMYLDVLETENVVRFSAHAGQRKPAFASSSGRALLGSLPAEQRDALVARMKFKKFTPATSSTAKQLLLRIVQGNKSGWHINLGEHLADTASISVAFRLGTEHYALVIGAPLHRFRKNLSRFKDALTNTAGRLNKHHLV